MAWLGDLRGVCPAAASAGNPIKASCRWVAFSTEAAGVLGFVPLESRNGSKRTVLQLCCHSGEAGMEEHLTLTCNAVGGIGGGRKDSVSSTDVVKDLDFSPFDEQLLATGSADESIKVWRLPDGDQELSSSPHVTLGAQGGPVDAVLFHPTADGVLASGAQRTVKVWDVEQKETLAELEHHEDQVQSLAWRLDGSLLGTSCKDKKLRVFDPRAKATACQSTEAHANAKDSRLTWINAEGCLLSVGFNQVREREVRLWDTRRFGSPLASITLDASP
ncbi:hypothetical protein JD844_020171, partial [Phrynosoma platyrhinos]